MTEQEYELKKKLELIKHNEYVNKQIKRLQNAKKWIGAKEGEDIGHGNYYVVLEDLKLRAAFMGYGTGDEIRIEFNSGGIERIFGEPELCGRATMTMELADALISLLESTLIEELL